MKALDEIRWDLEIEGHCLVDGLPEDAAKALIRSLGRVILETNVRVEPESDSRLHSAEAMPWHQDSPEARWIAWYCRHPGREDSEPTQILDAKPIWASRSKPDRQKLAAIPVTVRSASGDAYERPLALASKGDSLGLYYCPWLMPQDLTAEQAAALAHLEASVSARETESVSVRWKRGRTLIIDNHRMLHRRPRLDVSSARHLERAWVGA